MSTATALPPATSGAKPSRELTQRDLFGMPICAATMADAVALAERAIERRETLLVGVVNAAKIVNMRRDPRLDAAVRTAHVIFADGMSVVWASRLVGRRLPERVAGIDLMLRLLERANERCYRVFCLGATQEILDQTVARLKRDYPSAIIAGAHHGYFRADEEERVAQQIRDSRADMIFAAMTSPKKEEFLARWAATMNVPVCHGVGGAFDVFAGKVKRAPGVWQKLGMEWLYRTLQEPRRLAGRYFVTNTAFIWLVCKEFFRSTRPAANAS